MCSVLSGNSSYQRALQETFLRSKILEGIRCPLVSGKRWMAVIKRHQNIPALPWHIGPHACASLLYIFESRRADVVEALRFDYGETKVVMWRGWSGCATIANAG
jgi:hypothetical protein